MSEDKLYALVTVEVVKRDGLDSGLYTEQQFHNFLRDVNNYLDNRQMTNRDLVATVVEVRLVKDGNEVDVDEN